MDSPFSDRSMITDSARFFGRTQQLTEVFNALAAAKPQCVSIIGDKRIGRSSLLYHIEHHYSTHLPQPDRYRFIYLDLARDTFSTPEEFYAEVAHEIFGQPYPALSPQHFDNLLQPDRAAHGLHTILLLDEFNKLQQRKAEFTDDFYDGLRARANAGELTIVLASHLPLHEVAKRHEFASTFFGIFEPVLLAEFSREEARQSVLRRVDKSLQPTHFAMLERWLGREYHPFKLNIAADLIWRDLPRLHETHLKARYDEKIAHAFGEKIHTTREKQQTQAKFTTWLTRSGTFISWFTNEKPYLLIIVLVIILLLVFGVFNWDQLLAAFMEKNNIPTLTPTPIGTPTPLPTLTLPPLP